MKLLNQREPIEKVLERKDITPEQRHKLELTLKIRDFATKRLHLHESDSYKTYVDLKRPYVTYIVTVADKWQLEPHLYWYPVVGSLPYKGFFEQKDAEAEAKSFDRDKYDVMMRGVSAYSTLGWFEDPLLSTMLGGADHHLVNLIFHESAHATLYIKSQADFNEQLATFIGNIGTEIYYSETEGEKSPALKEIADENNDEKIFSEFITKEINEMKEWYKTHQNKSEEERAARLTEIQARFKTNLESRLKTASYKGFANMKLNNASLLYFKTYIYDLSDFNLLYESFGRDIEKFLTFCKTLEREKNPHQKIKSYLSSLPTSVHPSSSAQ